MFLALSTTLAMLLRGPAVALMWLTVAARLVCSTADEQSESVSEDLRALARPARTRASSYAHQVYTVSRSCGLPYSSAVDLREIIIHFVFSRRPTVHFDSKGHGCISRQRGHAAVWSGGRRYGSDCGHRMAERRFAGEPRRDENHPGSDRGSTTGHLPAI